MTDRSLDQTETCQERVLRLRGSSRVDFSLWIYRTCAKSSHRHQASADYRKSSLGGFVYSGSTL